MNDSDGTMTSSPGPMPIVCSASASAVVQLETATASAAPTRAANAASNSATFGPWETQPDAMTSATASPSSPRSVGLANGTFITTPAPARRRPRAARSARHQATRRVRPSSMSISGSQPSSSRALVMSARRRGTPVDLALGAVLDAQVRVHHLEQHPRELVEARLDAAGDVDDLVADAGLRGQDVGPRDVGDEDEVHGLLAVADDDRRLAGGDALHPADEHLGVDAVDVHALAVDVEVAQGDVVQARHRVVAAQQPLVVDLGRAVQRVVGVRVVVLGGRELGGEAVDRRRRRRR